MLMLQVGSTGRQVVGCDVAWVQPSMWVCLGILTTLYSAVHYAPTINQANVFWHLDCLKTCSHYLAKPKVVLT